MEKEMKYVAPEVEILEVEVEMGFQSSPGGEGDADFDNGFGEG